MTIKLVAEVILAHDGKVLILKRSQSDERRPGEWDLPGGHADPGESDVQAALRELEEEAGVELRADDLTLVYGLTELSNDDTSVTWIYFVAGTSREDVRLSQEHSQAEWVTIEEAATRIIYSRHRKAVEYVRDNDLLQSVASL